MGKTIAIIGIVILAFGLLLTLLERFGLRGAPLPGDVYVRRGNWSFYFPIVTSVVLSVALTLILLAVSRFGRR